MSFFSWWLNYRFRVPRFWRPCWWKDAFWYNVRRFFFFIFNRRPLWSDWEVPAYLTDQFLKATAWMEEGIHGYPGDEAMLEDGIPEHIVEGEYDETRSNRAFAKWKEIIHKMRFAHFYMSFIEDDKFGWMIDNVGERKHCRQWALRKYPYIKEFLTEEYFNTMYDDESLKYSVEMVFGPPAPGKESSKVITFVERVKATGEVVEGGAPSEVLYPHWRIAKELEPQFNEGMDLFRKWYQALWD